MTKTTEHHSFAWLQTASFAILTALCIVFVCDAQPIKDSPSTNPVGQTTIIKKITPKEGYELIQKNRRNPDFVILDIRTPEEFESGYIEGAVNINYHSDSFTEDLNKLDKNKTYFIYCRTGRRSSDAVGIMTRQGFKEIYRIDGDIIQWKAAGLPVVKGTK
jgi:rhodanese-related sulfurtransferase